MTENDIAFRLDEFAQTHRAVLLGMHRELMLLKSDVESQWGVAAQRLASKLDQFTADQVGVLEQVEQQETTLTYAFEIKSSHLLGEVMRFSDKTRRLDNPTFHVF
jgi:hypothetical protein